MSTINSIPKIVKNWNIEQLSHTKVQTLKNEVQECIEILSTIRKELTQAYIVSQKIIIEEAENEYTVIEEQKARDKGEHHKDLDKKQRKEEQILKDINRLFDSKESIQDNLGLESDKEFSKKTSSNILYKILRLLRELVMKKAKVTEPKKEEKEQKNPEEALDESMKIISSYKELLKKRVEKIKDLPGIQEQIKVYCLRIADPKEYNKRNSITEQLIRKKQTTQKQKIR